MMAGIYESAIMLVEDNLNLQNSILDLLSFHGFHNVSAFRDGFRALSYCRVSRPDLAILDVEMPGLSGFEILEQIRLILPQVPVVLMSSNHTKSVILQACESGASTFFPKPFDSEMFCRKIEALLESINFFE